MTGKEQTGKKQTGVPETDSRIRLDKWLWHARFFKTRSLAAQVCRAGKVRVDGQLVKKASFMLKPGEILTFPRADQILVVRMLAPGERRGPAPEAQTLYEDLTPPPMDPADPAHAAMAPVAIRDRGTGRPTKAERRATDKFKAQD